MATKEALELIEKVNALYSGAMSQLTTLYTESMSQLIMITVSILTIVGVIIPALVSWLQSRQLNKEQKVLKSEIDNQIQQAIQSLKTQFAAEFAKESEKIQAALAESQNHFAKELARIEAQSNGQTFHLQSQQYKDQKLYGSALLSAVKAISHYSRSLDEHRLQRAWNMVTSLWAQITSKTFEDIPELEEGIETAINATSSINTNGRYDDLLKQARKKYKEAKSKQ